MPPPKNDNLGKLILDSKLILESMFLHQICL